MALEESDPTLEATTLRWKSWGALLTLLAVAVFPIYRLREPSRREAALAERQTQLSVTGGALYNTTCSSCHGQAGAGGIGPAIGTSDFLSSATDEQISELISAGVPGSQMSAYSADFGGSFTQQQIASVVAYLRSLETDAAANPDWRYPLSSEDLDGRDLYQLGCSSCHGVNLEGGVGPELGRGSDAADDSDGRIRTRIEDGRDEMPSFSGSLSSDQIDLIIGFLREQQS